MKRQAALVGVLAAVFGLTACGGGESDSGASSSDEIKLMVIGDLETPVLAFPELVTGAEAAAKKVNDAGGVNGRTIKIVSCNTQGDPNVSASCARKALSEKVSAVIGLLSLTSTNIVTALEAAKIPVIGSTDINPVDHTSPVSFPFDSSTVQLTAQVVSMPGWEECKHPAMMFSSDLESAARAADTFKNLYESLDIPVKAKTVPITVSMTDFRAQIATLLEGGTDCAWTASTPTPMLALVKAVAASGQDVKLANNAATLGVGDLKNLGQDAKGVYIASAFKLPGTPEGDEFVDAMNAVDKKAAQNQHAQSSYAGVLVFAEAAKDLEDFSAPKVLDALNSAEDLDVGVLAPISSFPADGGVSWIKRVAIFEEYEYQWDGEALKLLTPDPIDIKPFLLEYGKH